MLPPEQGGRLEPAVAVQIELEETVRGARYMACYGIERLVLAAIPVRAARSDIREIVAAVADDPVRIIQMPREVGCGNEGGEHRDRGLKIEGGEMRILLNPRL